MFLCTTNINFGSFNSTKKLLQNDSNNDIHVFLEFEVEDFLCFCYCIYYQFGINNDNGLITMISKLISIILSITNSFLIPNLTLWFILDKTMESLFN